jgi:hypothetical protein
MDRDLLPNLQIIGAAKCGTTSLHYDLSLHPQVCMSTPKETYFLERPDYREALDEYARCFPERAEVRGEASTSYTQYPRVPHIPERMHSLWPDTRLIYCVRDPVDRAEAHYQQALSTLRETRPIEEAFADPEHPYNPYSCNSRYALQVQRYLDLFPAEQLMIVDSADLAQRRGDTLRQVFRFLGVDESFESDAFGQRLNTGEGKIGYTATGARVEASSFARVARSVLPRPIRRSAKAMVSRRLYRDVPKVPLPADVRERVADALREDAAQFREITGRRFEHWSV